MESFRWSVALRQQRRRRSLAAVASDRIGQVAQYMALLKIAADARSPSSQQFCRDALAIVARLFRLWYRFRGDLRDRRGNPQPLDREQLYLKSIPLQEKLLALAQAHLDDDLLTSNGCSHFWKRRAWNPPTTYRNGCCAWPSSGARYALATAAAAGNSLFHVYSPQRICVRTCKSRSEHSPTRHPPASHPIVSSLLTRCSPSLKVCDYADISHKEDSRSASTANAERRSRGIIRHAALCSGTNCAGNRRRPG